MNKIENSIPIPLLGESSFELEVLRSKQPVLVAFSAPWSLPCQVIDPVLQELAGALAGSARVVRVNSDESLGLSLLYEVRSIPTLLCFVGGRPILRIIGTATKQAILAQLKALGVDVPGPSVKRTSDTGRQTGKEN